MVPQSITAKNEIVVSVNVKQATFNSSLPWVHLLQSPLCLLGCQVALMVLSPLVFQGVHGLHADLKDPLSQEVREVQVLLLDPSRRGDGS